MGYGKYAAADALELEQPPNRRVGDVGAFRDAHQALAPIPVPSRPAFHLGGHKLAIGATILPDAEPYP